MGRKGAEKASGTFSRVGYVLTHLPFPNASKTVRQDARYSFVMPIVVW